MNFVVLSLLAVVSTVGAVPAFDQKPAGNPARINACTILTADVVTTFTTATKTKVKSAPTEAPTEAPIGANGSQCDYSGIALHIDPFATVTADRMRKSPERDWAPISGVGETAYFHDVKNALAEMLVWTGSHHFGILAEVPDGATSEQLKPTMIQVANLVAAKLK